MKREGGREGLPDPHALPIQCRKEKPLTPTTCCLSTGSVAFWLKPAAMRRLFLCRAGNRRAESAPPPKAGRVGGQTRCPWGLLHHQPTWQPQDSMSLTGFQASCRGFPAIAGARVSPVSRELGVSARRFHPLLCQTAITGAACPLPSQDRAFVARDARGSCNRLHEHGGRRVLRAFCGLSTPNTKRH